MRKKNTMKFQKPNNQKRSKNIKNARKKNEKT